MRSRLKTAAGLALLCLLAAGLPSVAQAGGSSRHPAAAQVGFWTGQNTQNCHNTDPTTCPRDLSEFTPAVWQALRAGHGALYFDLVYTVDFGPGATRQDAVPIIRKANQLGITIKAWFTAPVVHGTYANEDNAAFEMAAVKSFYQWRNANRLNIPEVVLDLEVPAGEPGTTSPTVDPAHQCAAINTYRRTIAWGHEHGLVMSGSPMPFLLDDLDNGDLALADSIDAGPLFPGAYDHIYLQAYRTYSDTGPDYPAQYLPRVHHYFGAAGEISLGDTTMGPPYSSVAALVSDVRVAVALGATAIPIFELASSVQKYGAAGIRQILDAGRQPAMSQQVAAAEKRTTMTASYLAFFSSLDTAASAPSPNATKWPPTCEG